MPINQQGFCLIKDCFVLRTDSVREGSCERYRESSGVQTVKVFTSEAVVEKGCLPRLCLEWNSVSWSSFSV